MSTKTGKVTQATGSASGASYRIDFPGPPPTSELWNDPPALVGAILLAAYTKGSDVDISYDDTTTPPTKTAVTAK